MTADPPADGPDHNPSTRTQSSSEEDIQAFFDHAADGILIADMDSRRFVECNRAMCAMLGRSREEIKSIGVEDVHPEESLPAVLEAFRRQCEGEMSLAPNCPVLRKDGTVFHADISSGPLQFRGRQYLIGMFREVSHRRRGEQALREAEQRYRALFQQSPHGIVIFDPETLLPIELNDRFLAILGFTRPEFAGMRIPDFEAVHDREQIRKRVSRILGEGFDEFETGVLRKDGSIAQVRVSVRAVELSGRRVMHAVVRDVSVRRRLEKQLQHAQKMEAVGQLAGGIAHDFNNVLTAIMGYANLAAMNLGDGHSATRYLDKILTSADRAVALTQGLLLFSRKRKPARSPLPLNRVVENSKALFGRLIGENIEVETRLTDRDPSVLVDAGQVEQVLVNLATNARDAMPRGGKLTITTELSRIGESFVAENGFGEPGEYATIAFADSGQGIDAKTRARVFEPFFTTKEVGKGTGLGLSIAYGIIKEHEGYIIAESVPGVGTTIRIYLPLLGEDDDPA